MYEEVLWGAIQCISSFVSGRLQASSKEERQKVGEVLMILVVILFAAIFLPLYGRDWLWLGLVILAAGALGLFGKDSVKLPLRRSVRPRIRQTVGTWKPPSVAKREDDHSDVGIGS